MSSSRGVHGGILAALLVGAAGLAQAQPIGNGFEVAGFRAYPWLDVLFNYESNYYRVEDGIGSISGLGSGGTWENIVIPGILFTALKGPDAYNLSYNARIGTVFGSSNDDFIDHRVLANANWAFGLRHRLRADYQYLRWHDRRGSGDPADGSRFNLSSHPDEWQSNSVLLEYSYGAPGARGRVDLRGGMVFRRYLNNNQEDRDNDRTLAGATFYARVRPQVSLLLETNWEGIDYVNQDPGVSTLDSTDISAYGGVTWDATAKTSGTLKLGWLGKDFDAAGREDISDFAWGAEIQWRPRTYSTVNLVTDRRPAESTTGVSDAVIISSFAADWIHYWKPYLYSDLGFLAADDDYQGTSRNDQRYVVSGGVFYQVRRWLEIGAEYRYETRTSDVPLADYTNNVFGVSLRSAY